MEAKREHVTLSYEIVGSQDIDVVGQKAPIIFLHGLTSAKETWKNVIHPIAKATARKAYALDARNHGDSGWNHNTNYEYMQEDLFNFMESMHIKQAVLIGHSMGGKTAMYFAAKRPERVEKLIVEDMSPKPAPQHVFDQCKKYINMLQDALKKIPEDVKDLDEAKNVVHKILQKNEYQEDPSFRHGANDGSALPLYKDENGKFKWKTNLKSILEVYLNQSTHVPIKGKYTGPTLMLYGTKSSFKVSSDRDIIRKLFPSAQFRAIEGATHQLHLEYEDIFINEVVDFINDS